MIPITTEKLTALTRWAAVNHHPAPVYNPVSGTVHIADMNNNALALIIDQISASDIQQANDESMINSIMDQAGIRPNELEACRRWAHRIIKTTCSNWRTRVTGGADASTLAGWADKVSIAERVVAGTASAEDTSILQTESDMRGNNETPEELAAIQIAKARALRTVRASIDGIESHAWRKVELATETPQISDAINNFKTIVTSS